MKNPFLSKAYVALALINAKSQIFSEQFVTTSELNQFSIFIQREFNERELGIVIVHELGIEDFNVKDGIVTTTDRCCYNLYQIPDELFGILTDKSLILKFFMELENERIEILKNFQNVNVKGMQKKLEFIMLPKASSKGILNSQK